jgi:hypothetical protein
MGIDALGRVQCRLGPRYHDEQLREAREKQAKK